MSTEEKEQKLHKLLDWYYDCASDEEFDAAEVISLLNQLDELEPIDPPPWESDQAALSDFWKYVKQREDDDLVLTHFNHISDSSV